MHPKNIHHQPYNFELLCEKHPDLNEFVFINEHGNQTIHFSDSNAVFHLNKAILKTHYNIYDWNIPKGYLCPPIPSRADYIHYIADLIDSDKKKEVNGLDIGVGANCIYSILGAQIYSWFMVGSDINETAVITAKQNVAATPYLSNYINIIHQTNNANIFKGIIQSNEYYDFTLCNPPFFESEEKALKANKEKTKNLGLNKKTNYNFGGQANELWCNGGEALFIKRMIKQSVEFKNQVNWFTCLVSKVNNLPKIYKQLNKLQANHKTIEMEQGNKKTRFIAWQFN
ncbi:23S rRNA (adenine(1618)-N(6))-methyltransferase RlmF [Pseudofulvibacter geojedonensis]|uniref:Ribosomal RNA large subunit methyltransferase F n=1 Tax=Pseudofulvibacter geojedonensis TaxID=1123758 RepID=A0ABW3HYP1_9FLAO